MKIKYILSCLIYLLAFTASAQEKPIGTYVSQKLWFAKHLPNKNSFEPFGPTQIKKRTYIFKFYKDYITVTTKQTIKLKILSTSGHKNGMFYKAEDEYHLKYDLDLLIDADDRKDNHADIDFVEYAKDNTPSTVRMISCKTTH